MSVFIKIFCISGLGQNVDKWQRETKPPPKTGSFGGGSSFFKIWSFFQYFLTKIFLALLWEHSGLYRHFWLIYRPWGLQAGFVTKSRAEISAGRQKFVFFRIFSSVQIACLLCCETPQRLLRVSNDTYDTWKAFEGAQNNFWCFNFFQNFEPHGHLSTFCPKPTN